MANNLVCNPMTVDTAATLWSNTVKYVKYIQWIDDAADMADDDDLLLVINGATITGKIQITNNTANNLCFWEFGPFDRGIPVDSFIVSTIDHGILVIVLE
jgi:hypothetical protein